MLNDGNKLKKIAFHTLGCKVNSYETEAMMQMFRNAGYEIVSFDEKADVYVVNTCSVTNMADRKSRQMLHRAKKKNNNAIVVAAGCYAQISAEKILDDELVDIVVGNNKKHEIVEIIENYAGETKGHEDNVTDISDTDEYEDFEISVLKKNARAYVKIQDGCDNFCSYCIIPYARGRSRSRKTADVIEEVEKLAAAGHKEIVITGIEVGDYLSGETKFIDILEQVDRIKNIERIRLSSINPEIVTENFADRLSKLEKVCPHFHLSLQSGCDKVLRDMNRHYTTFEYTRACERLRRRFDNPAITTDVIVGFPGESIRDFEDTMKFVRNTGFAELHVFKYSKRGGTPAASRKDQVSDSEKNIRSAMLIEAGRQLKEQYKKSRLNTVADVLFEERLSFEGKKYWSGHTPEYIRILLESDEDLAGRIRPVELKRIVSDEFTLATDTVLY